MRGIYFQCSLYIFEALVKEHIKKIKQEKPEMDDFEEEKNFFCKAKKLRKFQYLKKIFEIFLLWYPFLTETLAKMSLNIVTYSFVSEHFKHFLYLRKKLHSLSAEGVDPPPHTPFSGCVR